MISTLTIDIYGRRPSANERVEVHQVRQEPRSPPQPCTRMNGALYVLHRRSRKMTPTPHLFIQTKAQRLPSSLAMVPRALPMMPPEPQRDLVALQSSQRLATYLLSVLVFRLLTAVHRSTPYRRIALR